MNGTPTATSPAWLPARPSSSPRLTVRHTTAHMWFQPAQTTCLSYLCAQTPRSNNGMPRLLSVYGLMKDTEVRAQQHHCLRMHPERALHPVQLADHPERHHCMLLDAHENSAHCILSAHCTAPDLRAVLKPLQAISSRLCLAARVCLRISQRVTPSARVKLVLRGRFSHMLHPHTDRAHHR